MDFMIGCLSGYIHAFYLSTVAIGDPCLGWGINQNKITSWETQKN